MSDLGPWLQFGATLLVAAGTWWRATVAWWEYKRGREK